VLHFSQFGIPNIAQGSAISSKLGEVLGEVLGEPKLKRLQINDLQALQ